MKNKTEKLFYKLSIGIFIVYLILMLWVIMFKCNMLHSITDTYLFFKNFTLSERFYFYIVPFKDYIEGPFLSQIDTIIQDDLLNVFLFVPFGMYLTLFLKKRSFIKVLLMSCLLSSILELFQLITIIGSFSTKDIITNTIGGIFGYFINRIIYKENNSINKIKVLNIISTVVLIIFIPLTIYAVFNTMKHFEFYLNIIKQTF